MHFYEINERKVTEWNSVYALMDENRPLQHGSVVNVVENGLIVDFHCPARRSVLVEFGKVFDAWFDKPSSWFWCGNPRFPHPWEDDYGPPPANADRLAVRVLLRARPEDPWVWYPGKLLIFGFEYGDDWMFVEVDMGGALRRELIHSSQMLYPMTDEELQRIVIKPGDFVTRCVNLPEGYWTSVTPALSAALSQKIDDDLGGRCISVLSEKMLMMQHRTGRPITADHLAGCFEKAKTVSGLYVKCGREYRCSFHPPPLKTKRKKPLTTCGRGISLPLILLADIFQSLDTIGRLRCRRTCYAWDAILTSAEVCSEVRVSFDHAVFTTRWSSMDLTYYAVYNCILKHITPATRRICFLDYDKKNLYARDWGKPVIDCVRQVLSGTGRRIQRLVFCKRYINLHDENLAECFDEMVDSYRKLAAVCDKTVYRAVILEDECLRSRIRHAVIDLKNCSATELWDMFESHLDAVIPPAATAERIVQELCADRKESVVAKILHSYQSADPRHTNHYRDWKWTEENLQALDITKLNRTTLCALNAKAP
ncbi:uncharacterized protein LOC129602748 [Paramacrobiotus metropolitanus]|uniref:uncharacterized protein LOC129602748 n=1 Tax=Paramacrobiotus metropolitanus TaxID=2943436 RepID=UPI002445ACE6|nr:uncharacterized protein LOC129602748 [Paramacrobiotus metropolitanus]